MGARQVTFAPYIDRAMVLLLLLVLGLLAWVSVRLGRIDRRLDRLEEGAEGRASAYQELVGEVAALRARLSKLEYGTRSSAHPPDTSTPPAGLAGARREPPHVPARAQEARPPAALDEARREPPSVPLPPLDEAPPPPAALDDARREPPSVPPPLFQGVATPASGPTEEWEEVIGGNWLNKLGVLVLVIGISLFVAYSLTRLGPAGRIAVGFGASLTMLAAGVLFERRAPYTNFGRALIGGGWAAAYFTTYAMYAVDAARIVTDPLVATIALSAVSFGMILHSLRYESQVVTGLAYFVAFVTLAIGPSTQYSVGATLPLAASLLWVAQRSSWSSMAAMGIVATYGTYLFTTASAADVTWAAFVRGQMILGVYWLMFEAFDILAVRRGSPPDRLLLPFNALAYLGVAYLQWSTISPETLHRLFALAAGGYALSTVLRARLSRTAAPPEGMEAPVPDTSYRWSLTAAAILAAVAIALRFEGQSATIGFLLLGEALFFSGLVAGDRYIRWLAAAALALTAIRTGLIEPRLERQIQVGPWTVMSWTPTALFTAAVLYLNRARLRGRPLIAAEMFYLTAAATLVTLVVGAETPDDYVGVAWLALAGVLGMAAERTGVSDFRYQAVVVAVLAVARLWEHDAFPDIVRPATMLATIGTASLMLWVAFWRLRPSIGAPHASELVLARHFTSAAAATFLAVLCGQLLPEPVVALGFAVLGGVLLDVGPRLPAPNLLRAYGHAALALMVGRLFTANVSADDTTFGITHRVLTFVPAIALLYVVAAWGPGHTGGRGLVWERRASRAYLWAAMLLAVLLVGAEFDGTMVAAGWSVLALTLLVIGLRLAHADLRWQGYFVAFLVAVGTVMTLEDSPDRLVLAAIAVVMLHTAHVLLVRHSRQTAPHTAGEAETLTPADGPPLERRASLFVAAAALIVAQTLYLELSAGVLTVGWGIQGGLLLAAGFAARDRTMRRLGLLLLAVCTIKAFAYDFRSLDALSRILSFIVLGLLMLATSWVYARYRDRLREII